MAGKRELIHPNPMSEERVRKEKKLGGRELDDNPIRKGLTGEDNEERERREDPAHHSTKHLG